MPAFSTLQCEIGLIGSIDSFRKTKASSSVHCQCFCEALAFRLPLLAEQNILDTSRQGGISNAAFSLSPSGKPTSGVTAPLRTPVAPRSRLLLRFCGPRWLPPSLQHSINEGKGKHSPQMATLRFWGTGA